MTASALPIRTQLLLAALIVAIPAASVVLYAGLQARSGAMREATQVTEHLADEIATHQRNLASGTEQLLRTLAQLPEVQGHDTRRVHELLAQLLSLNSQYTNIVVADAAGRVWAQATDAPPFDVADRLYFRKAVESRRFASGEYVVSRANGRPAFNFALAYLDTRGAIAGVLVAGINVDAFRRLISFDTLPPGSSYLLVDHAGIVLTRAFEAERYAGRPYPVERFGAIVAGPDQGAWTGSSMAGDGRHVAYRKVRLEGEAGPYMYVLAGIPVAPVLAGANKALVTSIAVLSPFLLLAALLTWLMWERSFVGPVGQLEEATRRLAGGDLQVRVSDLVEGGEFGALAKTFDDMARQLAEREKARQVSEQLYRQLFEMYSDALFLIDQQSGRILEANPAAASLLGYGRNELRSMLDTDLACNPERAREERLGGTGRQLVEGEFRHQDGRGIPCEAAARFFTMDGRAVVLTALRDVRPRREAEVEQGRLRDQLAQSQKMETVGRLAGGIAHDFNNLLCIINGHCDLVLESSQLSQGASEDLQLVRQAGESAAALTRQLLTFSRKQIRQPKILDLNGVVAQFDKMLRRVIGEDIKVTTQLEAKLWSVHADPGQMEQVLINLVVNARDAIQGGGAIVIETANVVLDESYTRHHKLVSPGEYILLAVSDNGVGMDAATLERVFEPFFTTKPSGQGTGLGLSTVYGIVSQGQGHVTAYSEPGRGTTFKVYLPRVQGAPVPLRASTVPLPPIPPGTTVLVAEDSAAVRNLIAEVLSQRGFRVLQASTGEEAVAIAEQYDGEIHLLITDVVMPGAGGRRSAERLLERRPDVRVLYVSGYTEDAILSQGLLDASIEFLEKPFTPRGLVEKALEVLGRTVSA